ncbi:helix-turn-helix domain-containing protein [Streptomyces sp. NPDC050428]|uniref:helix-turn-helix domain-containing protein n=1 Tax=Streptomyces sp. NPDC050428 TaxID=3155757 RepID=UPI003430E45A
MVLEAGGLDGPEKLLLIAYCNRTDDHGYCWPGQQRVADDCGTSPATVKRVKKKLVEKGLIASKRRLDPRTGEPITNLTRVNIELLAAMKRKPTDYDDNVVEQLTFDAYVPLPQKKRKASKGSGQGADQVMAQDEPHSVDNPDTRSDLLIAQDEPDPGPKLSPGTGQDGPDLPLKLSPGTGQVEPLTVSDPPQNHQGTVRPSVGSTTTQRTDGRPDGGDIGGKYQEEPRAAAGSGPAVSAAAPDNTDAATAAAAEAGADARAVEMTPGIEVLRRMGRRVPKLALAGKPLLDQGRRCNERIASGWSPGELLEALCIPFDDEIRTSPGAVVSGRISALPLTPNSASPWRLPEQASGATPPPDDSPKYRRDAVAAAAWTWTERQEQLAAETAGHGVTRNCTADSGSCDRLAETGHDMCGHHLGWPACENGCGKFIPPGYAPMCETCEEGAAYREMIQRAQQEPPPQKPCPGHRGQGCERSVQTTTELCFRCEMAAAKERKQADDAEWEEARAAAVAAANETVASGNVQCPTW